MAKTSHSLTRIYIRVSIHRSSLRSVLEPLIYRFIRSFLEPYRSNVAWQLVCSFPPNLCAHLTADIWDSFPSSCFPKTVVAPSLASLSCLRANSVAHCFAILCASYACFDVIVSFQALFLAALSGSEPTHVHRHASQSLQAHRRWFLHIDGLPTQHHGKASTFRGFGIYEA